MPRLDIETYFVEELLVKTRSEYDRKSQSKGAAAPEVDFDFFKRPDDDDPTFLVKLSAEVGRSGEPQEGLDGVSRPDAPYHIRITVLGVFRTSDTPNDATTEQLVVGNAAPILYGIARGVVGQATSQGLHGRYVLATVNFVELMALKAQELSSQESP